MNVNIMNEQLKTPIDNYDKYTLTYMNWKDNENNKNYNRLIIKNNQLERGLASARNESVSLLRKDS